MTGEKPLIIRDRDEMRKWSRSMRAQGNSIGLVPTMGYLHQGHLSLVTEAHTHVDLVVVSIYVNPGQFSPNEDLSTYPSNFEGDIEKLRSVPRGVDVVFNPYNLYDYGIVEGRRGQEEKKEKAISYVDSSGYGHETWIRVENLEKGLCGKSRPIFFRGVATVVTKLFNIVEPDIAVFGKKDYQQWRIIQRMASSISRSLYEAKRAVENGELDCTKLRNDVVQAIQKAGGKVDYDEIVDQETLESVEVIQRPVVFCIAAWFGNVRLLDNMEINV